MSIIKFANGKCRRIQQLREVITYILDPEKTSTQWTTGFGVVNEKTAFKDMYTYKALYYKLTGRQYIHFILSYDALKKVTPDVAFKVGQEVGNYYASRYQILMATHVNTKNYHCHYVLNTVSVEDGSKFCQSKKDLLKFREFINGILRKHALPIIEKRAESNTAMGILGQEPDGGDYISSGNWLLRGFDEDKGEFLEMPLNMERGSLLGQLLPVKQHTDSVKRIKAIFPCGESADRLQKVIAKCDESGGRLRPIVPI